MRISFFESKGCGDSAVVIKRIVFDRVVRVSFGESGNARDDLPVSHETIYVDVINGF